MAKSNVTSLNNFVEKFSGHEFWVGADVHKRSYHIAIYRVDGKVRTFVCPACPARLLRKLQSLNVTIAGLAYEAGPTGFSLARIIQSAGIRVIVAAPSRIPRPVLCGAKTDRLDCIKLAEYAAKGMIKSIVIPTEKEEAKRSLIRRRHLLVDSIRKCKQRIKGKLLFLGLQEPQEVRNWTKNAPEVLLALPMDDVAKLALESFLREFAFLQEELKTILKKLNNILQEEGIKKTMACLKSVPGVGMVVASTFCMELFRPERFTRAEEVTSYVGLAPMVYHSGENNPSGRLKPVGQRRLRSLLIEAAWMWRSRDKYAQKIYNRFLGKTGIPQKAITALARKLAVILWRLSVEKRTYRKIEAV